MRRHNVVHNSQSEPQPQSFDFAAGNSSSSGSSPSRSSSVYRPSQRRPGATYRRLQQCDHDRGFSQYQFVGDEKHIPYKAIILAAVLSVFGAIMITISLLLMFGYIDDMKYNDRMWPVLVLGALMFIPGAYHVRIAYYAYCGERGYSFDDIPDFD